MDELQSSCFRIAVLVEIVFFVCFCVYGPQGVHKAEYIKKEYALYKKRKEFLERHVKNLQREIDLWEVTPLQKETFAREQLNMARPDEIVYYCSQPDNHNR